MSGYIYCFSNENMNDTYKIGFTTRCPLMRLREANNGDTWSLSNKFNIEFAKEVSDCREKEKQIHKHLSIVGERVCENREFFKVPLEVIRSLFELIDGRWYNGKLEEKKDTIIDKKDNEIVCGCIITQNDITNCENAITCGVCSKIYKNLATYNQHIIYKRCNKILIPKPIDNKCQYCENIFASKQSKIRHESKCSEINKTCIITVEEIKKIVDDKIKSIK
jgi:hypothetical protein